jgi:DNA-binding transcriptional regulator YdaS (Cro superfamily)
MTQETKSKQDRSPALVAAVALAGGYASLAAKLGLNKATVHQWNRVPAERVLAVEAATGVPRQRLRPDIYPD